MEQPVQRRCKPGEAGVTLIEMLVVVAIIGVLSLVSIPAFVSYFQSSKVKGSLRKFTNDVRFVRQRAVSRNRPVKITFDEGSRTYQYFDGDFASPPNWTQFGATQTLDDTVTIHSTTFEDLDADDLEDIVFQANGAIAEADFASEAADAFDKTVVNFDPVTKVVLRASIDVPTNEYRIYFQRTGQMTSVRSSW